nr:hypothetical protein [Tanacetum cinerariifolium]
MPYVMLLTRLFKHILQTNPQSINPFDRFTYHERVMNPLDIPRKTIKDKGKRADPSSSSSSSDENEEPSFLEFYEKLSDNENLIDEKKENRGMFKCLNRYFDTITKSTHYTSLSSPSESLTPTHVVPPPILRLVIPMKLEPQELPQQTLSANDPYVLAVNNWPPGPLNLSPPPRVYQPPLVFLHPPPRFEQHLSPQPLFVNINNNAPQLENTQHPSPNIGNQDFPNPPNNILDLVHPNDMPYLHNMFCQCCSTTRHEIQMLRNQIKEILNHLDKLPLDRIEGIEDNVEGL